MENCALIFSGFEPLLILEYEPWLLKGVGKPCQASSRKYAEGALLALLVKAFLLEFFYYNLINLSPESVIYSPGSKAQVQARSSFRNYTISCLSILDTESHFNE